MEGSALRGDDLSDTATWTDPMRFRPSRLVASQLYYTRDLNYDIATRSMPGNRKE
jgi:hypothetical protein